MSKRRKILLWVTGVLVGLIIVLQLTLQFLAPAILNSESIKSKIEKLASEEIGADITFRRIDLSLLPRFIVVVRQFGLSAPGTAEGTVETIRVYPKLSHLLVGKFHIARAVLEAPDFAIVVSDAPDAKKQKRPKKQEPETTFTEEMEKVLGPIFGVLVPSPGMAVTIERCKLDLTEGTKPLFAIRDMDVRIVFPPSGSVNVPYQEILSAGTSGHHRAFKAQEFMEAGMIALPSVAQVAQAAPTDSSSWPFRVLIDLKTIDVQSKLLPGPVTITGGTVETLHEKLSFTDLRLDSPGTSLTTSGSIGGYQTEIEAIDIAADGTMATPFTRWLIKLVGVAPEVNVRSALTLSDIHLMWDNDNFSFTGSVAAKAGPRIEADIRRSPGEVIVKKLTIQDQESRAALSLTLNKEIVDFAFSGNLTSGTTNKFIIVKKSPNAWIKGDFRAHILLDRPMQSTAQGTLRGRNLLVPLDLRDPPIISRISLQADKNAINVLPLILRWGKNHLSVNGSVNILREHFQIDMDVSSGGINLDTLQKKLGRDADDEEGVQKGKKDGKETEKGWDLPFQGNVRFRAAFVAYDHYTVRPLHADITFIPDGVRVSVPKSLLCGIATTGTVALIQNDIHLDLKSVAKDQELESAIRCLTGEDVNITGTFNLAAQVTAQGTSDDLMRSLSGTIAFDSKEGKVYRYLLLSRLISFLSVTEILRGKVPDLGTEGFAYHTMMLKSTLQNGTITLQELSVDGATMDIFAQGDVDMVSNKLDLKIVVAPFGTANWVVGKIPVVNYILAGTLISLPIKVAGDRSDPKVTYLPASAVGAGLLGVVKRTLQVPVKLVEPVIPGGKKKEDEKQD